jgi:fructose-specific phosphotransferase system IIC component
MSGEGWYARGWRPAFGYAVAFGWAATTGAVAWAIVSEPALAPAIIAALIDSTPLWGMALGVLGVAVVKRSQDKARRSGDPLSRE